MARTTATDKEEEVAEVFVDSQVLIKETKPTDLMRNHEPNARNFNLLLSQFYVCDFLVSL
jgi:hypothetical protein